MFQSPKLKSQTEGNVERVAVGSFDPKSPFYQMNLNDLKPFAMLEVNRLDVFPLLDEDCSTEGQYSKKSRQESSHAFKTNPCENNCPASFQMSHLNNRKKRKPILLNTYLPNFAIDETHRW